MAHLTLRSLDVNRILDMENVHVEFHPRLTVLTGTNSAGKTMLCGASVLALLGLQALKSTHWSAKIAGDNLARRGTQGGETSLRLTYQRAEYAFTYRHRKAPPHEASGPEGPLSPLDALRLIGIDVRAVGFLTTSERRPPWMVVEGDDKTGDVKTVLRNSLQTTLATRVDGCKGVRGIIETEIRTIEQGIGTDKQQVDEIVKRWLEKSAFAEFELRTITAAGLNDRLNGLSTLRNSLQAIQGSMSQLGALTELESALDKVKDLPELIRLKTSLGSFSEKLDTRLDSLARLDRTELSTELPALEVVESDPLVQFTRNIHRESEQLLKWLKNLEMLGVTPPSGKALSEAMSEFQDQGNKLTEAKAALAEPSDAHQVLCKVYRGKRLLVQLGEDFACNVSAEEIRQAGVIAPYSEDQEERVRTIVGFLKDANTSADALKTAIQTTGPTVVNAKIGDVRVLIAEKQTSLKGFLPSIRELNCPADRFPDEHTGARLDALMEWVRGRSAHIGGQVAESVRTIKELLSPESMISWRARIEPHVDGQSRSNSHTGKESVAAIDQVIEDLKETVRSMEENKDAFVRLVNEADGKARLRDRYRKSVLALDTYLTEIQFKEETVQVLTEKFLDFVRSAQELFAFRFKFGLDDSGSPELCREDLDGTIHTGGGETQVLGVLMMLAVAAEFGFPVFIDEIGSYLHQHNLRKLLEFIFHQTEVQVILTTADEELLERLMEWGLEHKGYAVTKDSAGFTHVS